MVLLANAEEGAFEAEKIRYGAELEALGAAGSVALARLEGDLAAQAGTMEAGARRLTGRLNVFGLQSEAALLIGQSKFARGQGALNAGTTLLSGVGQAAGQYGRYFGGTA